MDGEFPVFVGEWKCDTKRLHGEYLFEPVEGTDYAHTLHIYSNGKYRISLPDERDNKGRIREIRNDSGGRYYFEFICNYFTSKRILTTGWCEVYYDESAGNYYLSITTNGIADFKYVKVN